MGIQLLFFVLSAFAILGALGMLLSRNPVSSALWLVLNLFCIAGLYLTLNATFIAVVQVLSRTRNRSQRSASCWMRRSRNR